MARKVTYAGPEEVAMTGASLAAGVVNDDCSVVSGPRVLRGRELNARIGGVAERLAEVGVRSGDRVALILENGLTFVIIYLALWRLGAVPVTISPTLHGHEVRELLSRCPVRCVVAQDATGRAVGAGLQAPILCCDADDERGTLYELGRVTSIASVDTPAPTMLAAIMFTSGSSGKEKGAGISFGNVETNVTAQNDRVGLTSADRVLAYVPLSHAYGQVAVMLATLRAGATLIVERGFDPARLVQTIRREQCTVVFGTPALYRALLPVASPHQVASVRSWVSDVAPLEAALKGAWKATLDRTIIESYGSTELQTVSMASAETPAGSVGQALRDIALRIVEPSTGSELPQGAVGELHVSGPSVFLGYWDAESGGCAPPGRWFATGDLARVDEAGNLFIMGRLKNLVRVGGRSVIPREVEEVIARFSSVREVAVFGVEEPVLGEELVALVAWKEGQPIDIGGLLAHCHGALAPFKCPTRIVSAKDIPHLPTGKIDGQAARAIVRRRRLGTAARSERERPGAEEAVEWVLRWLQGRNLTVLDRASTTREASLLAHGVDSLHALRLRADLEDYFGLHVEVTELLDGRSIAELANTVVAGSADARRDGQS